MPVPDVDLDLSRRDTLRLTAALGGLGTGLLSAGRAAEELVPGGGFGGSTTALGDGHVVLGGSFADAIAAVREPGLVILDGGQYYTAGSGLLRLDRVDVSVGQASTYDEAAALVDRYPTIVLTADGEAYEFHEADP